MIKLPDHIKTLGGDFEFRIKEKGSLFISMSKNVESEEEAISFLNSLRKKFYDATHHCYSYNLVGEIFKYSDDGEPNGTAGIRIYNAQNHFELTNLITVVIRYFGGTKLGVGPLGKAYYESALGNLTNSKIDEKFLHNEIIIYYNYDQSKIVHHLASKHNLIIKENVFGDRPQMICLLPSTNQSNFFMELSIINTHLEVFQTDKYLYVLKNK